jgi:tetratricopeptide (TPR) repeat protein
LQAAFASYNQGNALRTQRKLDEALTAYRKAIELAPDFAEAHCNLGHTLRDRGQFVKALASLKKGHDLGKIQPGWRYPSERWVADCEQEVRLDARLTAVLKGQEKVKNSAEHIELTTFCLRKGLPVAAAQFCQKELTPHPDKTDIYEIAACAAALAGCGKGEDAAGLDEKERVRWREQALAWMKAALDLRRQQLKANQAQARQVVQSTLEGWLRQVELAGLREVAELAKLPEAEGKQWQQFWSDVAALLRQAQAVQP